MATHDADLSTTEQEILRKATTAFPSPQWELRRATSLLCLPEHSQGQTQSWSLMCNINYTSLICPLTGNLLLCPAFMSSDRAGASKQPCYASALCVIPLPQARCPAQRGLGTADLCCSIRNACPYVNLGNCNLEEEQCVASWGLGIPQGVHVSWRSISLGTCQSCGKVSSAQPSPSNALQSTR